MKPNKGEPLDCQPASANTEDKHSVGMIIVWLKRGTGLVRVFTCEDSEAQEARNYVAGMKASRWGKRVKPVYVVGAHK